MTCGECAWFKQAEATGPPIGECVNAIERTRKVAPLSVNLNFRLMLATDGWGCPMFEAKQPEAA